MKESDKRILREVLKTMNLETKKGWLAYARQEHTKLIVLVETWHPRSTGRAKAHDLKITAPNAQAACNDVVSFIEKYSGPNPVQEFAIAIVNGDVAVINRILTEAWFGVPESTECWNLTGFQEACRLMESLPEDGA